MEKPRRSSSRRDGVFDSCTSAVTRRQAGSSRSRSISPRTASVPRPSARQAGPRPYPISVDPSGKGACLRPHSPMTAPSRVISQVRASGSLAARSATSGLVSVGQPLPATTPE